MASHTVITTDAATMTATTDTEPRAFSPSVALSNHMVRLLAAYVGRGPTKARATLNANLVVVTFGDTMTRAELNLVEAGEGDVVRSTRRIFHTRMREQAVAGVEEILDRKVIGYLADIDTDANMAILAFVLEPRSDGHVIVALDGRA